jgi:hypothetical protein
MSTVLNSNTVDKFVRIQNAKGNDVRWEGWQLVFFKRNPRGFSSKYGAFRNGWGMETRVDVNEAGEWKVPSRNVKYS